MKRILFNIILLSFTVALLGQIIETNRDFQWNGSFNPSDSTLIDSITGVSNSNYKVIDMDFDRNLGYIPCYKTKARLKVYSDTMYVQVWAGLGQRNFNDADTLYIQSNDTAIFRITHYSTSTNDANNFFNALEVTGTMFEVCATCTYTTWPSAITAASTNDTIILYSQQLAATTSSSKSLTHIGLGNVINAPATGTSFQQTAGEVEVHGIQLVSTNSFGLRTSINAEVYNKVYNCYLDGSSHIYDLNDNSDSLIIKNSLISGHLYTTSNVYSRYNTYLSSAYNVATQKKFSSNYDLFVGAATSIILPTALEDTLIFANTELNGVMMNVTNTTSSSLFKFNNCNIKSDDLFFGTTSFGSGYIDFIFDNCSFERSDFLSTYFINKFGDGDFILNNCEWNNNVNGNFIRTRKDTNNALQYDFIIRNSNFENTDTTAGISAGFYNVEIENNTFKNLNLNVINTDSMRNVIVNNNNIINYDSVIISFEGHITFSDNTYIADTSGGLNIIGDSIMTINNNSFSWDMDREQGNLLGLQLNRITENDGVFIYENEFLCPRYFGKSTINHLYNLNSTTRFYNNFVYGATIGCVSKNTTNNQAFKNEIYGNIFVECETPIFLRAMPRSKVYNNTIYNNSETLNYGIYIDDNDGGVVSDSCQIYNNIISSNTGVGLHFNTTGLADTTGLLSDNNIFYNVPIFLQGFGNTTLSIWQSIYGYDQNSYNTSPNFKSSSQLWPVPPSNAIGKGYNLGSPYNVGLDITSTWPDGIVTKNQLGLWSIGAYVVPLRRAVTSNSKIIIFNNKFLKQ